MSKKSGIQPDCHEAEPPPRVDAIRAAKFGNCGSASGMALRYGEPCPYCLVGKVDYDSLLNLFCTNCGKTQTGAFT
ncbi:MAG: hypothetical protein WA110_01320 [Anaerolineaceae bacterium]